ncbi:MAG TPA: phosphatase PAP2 family protein [Burkholderiaceae bacterium]|nr:phosphatase PAP2 family protein [Burkholderiaceae bacterium]
MNSQNLVVLIALLVPGLGVLGLRVIAMRWRPQAARVPKRGPVADRMLAIAIDVSALGSSTLTTFFTTLFAVALALYGHLALAVLYAACVVLAGMAGTWLKQTTAHERLPHSRTLTFGSSFPSTHTTLAVLCYGGAVIAAWPVMGPGIAARWAVGACVLTIGAVAASRLWLGAHRRRDVLGGLVLGAMFLVPIAAMTSRLAP